MFIQAGLSVEGRYDGATISIFDNVTENAPLVRVIILSQEQMLALRRELIVEPPTPVEGPEETKTGGWGVASDEEEAVEIKPKGKKKAKE